MADTSTTHLNLVKQDPNTIPDITKEHGNLDTLDEEIWARGKAFNGQTVGADGEYHIRSIPYAENLETSAAQSSEEAYVIRTTGGNASLQDGDAWLTLLRGVSSHTGYVPQSLNMEVVPMPREEGDDTISATIDDSTFFAFVSGTSGTVSLTYSTAWNSDPTLYGITVTGTPVAGDAITVVYQKEVRGLITNSTPTSFVSTGWNLYNHSTGYARVVKYSDEYNFKISGTYSYVEYAMTLEGERISITPVSGAFSVPDDGYVFVTGGNSTSTAIWMTWSDWANGYRWNASTQEQGAFQPYEESVISLSSFLNTNFPYGLLSAGTVHDEVNLNVGLATSNVIRQVYNSTNLASAKASGRQYEYDENYIYIERETPVTYSISVEGMYTANDHGMEIFLGTDQAVYAQTLYGDNLKNKLERDVLTISQQTLSNAQKAQARTNIGAVGDADAVHRTGAETVDGQKWFKEDPKVGGASRYKRIHFTQSGGNSCGNIYFDTGNVNNQTSNRMGFTEMSPKATPDSGNTGYGETYYLPAPTIALSANKSYDILTRKQEPILYQAAATTHTFYVPSGSRCLVAYVSDGATRFWFGLVYSSTNGAISFSEIFKGSNVSISSDAVNSITFTLTSSQSCYLLCIPIRFGYDAISNPT